MKMKNIWEKYISVAAKGFVIGGTMLVPGVSGGSMAMILGIYSSLISAVSSFYQRKRIAFVSSLHFASVPSSEWHCLPIPSPI